MNKFYLIENKYNKSKAKDFFDFVENNFNLVESVLDCDYILVLGGDGSMLSAIQKYKKLDKPFVGISTGTIGYYLHNIKDVNDLSKFINSKLEMIEFPLLEFEVKNESGEYFNDTCFADVWIERNTPQCLKYNISVYHDKTHIYKNEDIIIGDGILFSTPVGTTGYAKNIDDHILPIDLNVFQVVPIASSINKRHFKSFPLSLNDYHAEIELVSTDFRESRLIYDGVMAEIKNPNYLKVKYSGKSIKMAFLSANAFRAKGFSWIRH